MKNELVLSEQTSLMDLTKTDKITKNEFYNFIKTEFLNLSEIRSSVFTKSDSNDNIDLRYADDILSKPTSATFDPDQSIKKDISNSIIGENGIIEKWERIDHIPVKVIEINNENILLDCYDLETKNIEMRAFPKSLFDKNLQTDKLLLLKIYQKENKMVFEFEEATDRGYEKYFIVDKDEYINVGRGVKL